VGLGEPGNLVVLQAQVWVRTVQHQHRHRSETDSIKGGLLGGSGGATSGGSGGLGQYSMDERLTEY
jgi:hypothetical protein